MQTEIHTRQGGRRDGQPTPVGTDRHEAESPRGKLDLLADARRRHVPDPQPAIRQARGDQPRPVGAVGQVMHDPWMRQLRARFARGRVPQEDGVVPAARGDPAAVRAEGHRVDIAGVAAQHRQRRPRVHDPAPDRVVRRDVQHRGPTDGGEPAAVRGERDRGDVPRVAVQDRHIPPARRLPDPDGAVAARRGDPPPVRAIHGRGDIPRVAVVRRLDLPARRAVPLAHRPVR